MMKTLALVIALACVPSLARAGDDASAGRPSAVLLVVTTTPQGTVASFGQSGGDGGAAGAALARAVDGLGFKVRSASGQSIAVTTEGGNSLIPVGDQAALDVARKVGAAAAFVVGVNVKADGPIRGTHLLGAAGRGQLRLLDVQSGNLGESAEADGGGFDAALERAAAGASRDIVDHLVRAIESQAASRWPASSAPSGSGSLTTVEIRGAHAWGAVAAVIQRLGATEGVTAVHARDVRRGHIVLAVDTRLGARSLAAAVERARLSSGTLRATASGDGKIVVDVRGDSAAPAPAPTEQP